MATIFFVTPRFPWPLTKGDQLRAYKQITELSRSHDVVLFSVTDEEVKTEWIDQLRPYCTRICVVKLSLTDIILSNITKASSGLPFQTIYHFNKNAARELKELYDHYQPEVLIFQLLRMAPYAALFPRGKCIIDLMDCFSYHYLLRRRSSKAFHRWFYNIEYRRVKAYEQKLISQYNQVTVISKKDKELLPGNHTAVTVVSNGVDIPDDSSVNEKKYDLVFLGNLTYEPNIEAARFLAREILPLIHRHYNQVTLLIAGTKPTSAVLALQSQHVKVIPDVPSVYPVLASAKIFVAPMFLSTGVQNKILEALAAGLIVITTPNAADAIDAIQGKHLLTAVSAAEFASRVIAVLSSPADYTTFPDAANIFLRKNFDWNKNTGVLTGIINSNLPEVLCSRTA